jgi:aspartate/methionine/tyrosine aminotransferase
MKAADRIKDIQEYYFAGKLRELRQRMAEGEPIINLGIGSPDLPPHPAVIESLQREVKETGVHGYQPYKGIPDLRKAFSNWNKTKFNIDLNPESEILPLIGSKEGVMHIAMSFLNPGDVALVPNPGYPSYSATAKIAGAKPVSYTMTGARPDFEKIPRELVERVKIMWINYPHMPTGVHINESELAEIVNFARKNEILLCYDNPYNQILTEKSVSLFQATGAKDVGLELHSMSKSFNMAGWRVGFLTGKKELLDIVQKFKSNMDSGMFKPVQLAAVKAMETGEEHIQAINQVYAKRKNLGLQIMEALNCKTNENQSGMFIWAEIPVNWESAENFSDYVLNKYQVFVTPGHVFGSAGDQHIRLSLCSPEDVLTETLERIKKS